MRVKSSEVFGVAAVLAATTVLFGLAYGGCTSAPVEPAQSTAPWPEPTPVPSLADVDLAPAARPADDQAVAEAVAAVELQVGALGENDLVAEGGGSQSQADLLASADGVEVASAEAPTRGHRASALARDSSRVDAPAPPRSPPSRALAAPIHAGGDFGAAPPPPAAPLPSSGVLASTFVGGHGAASRLEDLMDRGVTIDGEHVRLSAFEDLGPLPYPVPGEEAVALYANLERTQLVEEGEHVHLQIALLARNGERPARPRMDVRLVLDRSGSMSGAKWTSAIVAAHALVDQLEPSDTFGLVSYSDSASLDFAPLAVGNRRAAHAAIDRLHPGGGTNIGAALEQVALSSPSRRRESDVLLVVLLSDGVASVGQTDPESLAEHARAMFDRSGIVTTTIGVGSDFDESTMLAIAREGSGSYEYVRRDADIAGILTQELDERAMAVAQDLRLRVVLGPGVSLARVYGSRILTDTEAARVRTTEIATDVRLARELGIPRDRQEDDDTGLRMHIPSFRRGDQHVVLMDLVVPPGTGQSEIARVTLDFKDLRTETNEHAVASVAAARTADRDDAALSVSRPVKRTVLAFQAGETLREASEALSNGDAALADRLLGERVELLEAAADLWHDPSMRRDARLLATYRRVVTGGWPSFDYDSQRTLALAMGYYGDQRME